MILCGNRLVSAKYQRAIAGLVIAKNTEWSLDVREHEFDDTEALRRALAGSSCLVSLNGLSLKNNEHMNISSSLQRDRSRCHSLEAWPPQRLLTDDFLQAHGMPGVFLQERGFGGLNSFLCFVSGMAS